VVVENGGMRIAVAGASGMIGTALTADLEAAGHEVVRLVRREPPGPGEVRWDPTDGSLDVDALGAVDALVNVAGATIDRRWTRRAKEEIVESRVPTTRLLAQTAASLEPRPALLVSSAIGVYGVGGSRGEEELTEESSAGTGFLAELVEAWEAAADPARSAGARVVHLRTSPVLSRRGGLLKRMSLPFRLGLGGRIGDGRQWWSWIELDDVVAGYRHALTSDLAGVVNLTSPNPVRNEEFVRALGRALHRPTVLPTPTFGIKLLFGEEAMREAVLYGLRVVPARLQAEGFEFRHPQLDGALAAALAE
jgi:uncharacterized protein (TIGR01777 family)